MKLLTALIILTSTTAHAQFAWQNEHLGLAGIVNTENQYRRQNDYQMDQQRQMMYQQQMAQQQSRTTTCNTDIFGQTRCVTR